MAWQKAPYNPYSKLRIEAEAFLAKHHPENTIPIPIEDIVDRKLKIDILPIPLAEHAIESYTSHDMSTFYIDSDVYNSDNTYRYRFSLAHELSHVILHKNFFEKAGFKDVAGWKEFSLSYGEDYKWIELQAYNMAGLLLVPTSHLLNEYSTITAMLANSKTDIRDLGPQEMKRVLKYVGDKFEVSSGVIGRRGIAEDLWSREVIIK